MAKKRSSSTRSRVQKKRCSGARSNTTSLIKLSGSRVKGYFLRSKSSGHNSISVLKMEHTQDMRTVWGPEDVQYLLVNFIEEKNKNKIVGYRVADKLMWERVLLKMVVFMPDLSVTAIQNKWKSLRKDYKAVTILRNEGGVLWDPTLGTVKGAGDGWWATMVQKCKETKRFRHHGCAHVDRMDMLWKDSAKGKKVKLEAAACDSDSLQRHGQLGGSSIVTGLNLTHKIFPREGTRHRV